MMNYGNLVRGILLVAGTSIGGGMLALPVLTGAAGFFPSLVLYLVCWLFMACTGLLFLEVSFWVPKDANIITMAERTLGLSGKIMAWGLYLFLFYCLTLAYIVGAGDLVSELFSSSVAISEWQSQVIFLILFGPFVYVGAAIVGRLNLFLMVGLGASYFAFVLLGLPYVNPIHLQRAEWSKIWLALPITFTAFAYQGIIPTLVNYLNRNVATIRLAILIGSFLPFIAYAVWQWLILGIVPSDGPNSLAEALQEGQNAVQPLKKVLAVPSIYIVGQYFAFFALVTSFFGVTLGLMDFLADGLKIKKTPLTKLLLCFAIFLPPFIFAFLHPHLFLIALDYAGGFGCALLLGLLPVLMVWRGRYRLGLKGEYEVFGGKWLLSLLIFFIFVEVVCEMMLMR